LNAALDMFASDDDEEAAKIEPDSDVEDLVAKVKDFQKRDQASAFAWKAYCEAHGDGVCDPKRHSDSFLKRALRELVGGGVKPIGARTHSRAPTNDGVSIVDRVKEYQRAGNSDAWQEYCDQHGGGMYDPSKHDHSFLRQALATLTGGGARPNKRRWQEDAGGGSEGPLTMQVKEFQRSHRDNAALWQDFCDWYGAGTYDPSAHSGSFVRQALSQLAGYRSRSDWLAERVKEWQRADRGNGETWAAYCDELGDGVYDPSKHSAEFLREAMEQLGGIPPKDGPPRMLPAAGAPNTPRPGALTAGSSKALLIEAVKVFQRSGGHERWQEYCDAIGSGVYDPASHTIDFLRTALESLYGGRPPSAAPQASWKGVPSSAAVDAVKDWQRQNRSNCEAWQLYCDEHGDGHYDPRNYSDAFLGTALERLAGGGGKRRRMEGPATGSKAEQVKEWQRTSKENDEVWKALCDTKGDGMYDPHHYDNDFLNAALAFANTTHQQLVDTLKGMQRMSRKNSENWNEFCDTYGNSTYDPKRHEDSFIRLALLYIESQSQSSSDAGYGSKGGGKSNGKGNAANDALVSQVKDWQRVSEANRDEWRAFCDQYGDGMYDPAKHPADFLKKAMKDLGISSSAGWKSAGPKGGGKDSGSTKGGGGKSSATSGAAGPLTETVRELQRSSPQAREAWKEHCDTHGGQGVYDPAAYTSQFLKDFIVFATVSSVKGWQR